MLLRVSHWLLLPRVIMVIVLWVERSGNPGGKKKPKPYKVADVELSSPKTDPQGMYTGIPADPDDEPVQDADDL